MAKSDTEVSKSHAIYVSELAQCAKVTPETVRFYTRSGLLRPSRQPGNRYRCYAPMDIHRVIFIRYAKRLGLTIKDIGLVLEKVDRGEMPRQLLEQLVQKRLRSVNEKIENLKETKLCIESALYQWNACTQAGPIDSELDTLQKQANRIISRNSSFYNETGTYREECPNQRC